MKYSAIKNDVSSSSPESQHFDHQPPTFAGAMTRGVAISGALAGSGRLKGGLAGSGGLKLSGGFAGSGGLNASGTFFPRSFGGSARDRGVWGMGGSTFSTFT